MVLSEKIQFSFSDSRSDLELQVAQSLMDLRAKSSSINSEQSETMFRIENNSNGIEFVALSDKTCQTKRIYKFSQSSQTSQITKADVGVQTNMNFPGDNLVTQPNIVQYLVDIYNTYIQLPDM